MRYIPELKKHLQGRMLEIWEGKSGLPPSVELQYQNAWRVAAGAEPRIEPCGYLRKYTGQTIDCESCGGKVRFKLYECKRHGRCTLEPANADVRNCLNCKDRAMPRHLACHIFPVSGNGVWQLAADNLRLRWSLFTGRKLIAVSTGSDLDSADRVRAYFPADAEIFSVPNVTALREVATWSTLWQALADEAGYVLYCHAKGVTRPKDPGNSCHWWSSLLWSLYLDHWTDTEFLLKDKPIVGSFKKLGTGFGSDFGSWHYSGSFFWCRLQDFQTRWPRIPVPAMWWGVEAWPGMAYSPDEAGCMFMQGAVSDLDLYSPPVWAGSIRPQYSTWVKERTWAPIR